MEDQQQAEAHQPDALKARDVRSEQPAKRQRLEVPPRRGYPLSYLISDVGSMQLQLVRAMTYLPSMLQTSYMIWNSLYIINTGRRSQYIYNSILPYDIALYASYIWILRVLICMQHGGVHFTKMSDVLSRLQSILGNMIPVPGFMIDGLRAISTFDHPVHGCSIVPALLQRHISGTTYLHKDAAMRLPCIPMLWRALNHTVHSRHVYLNHHTEAIPANVPADTIHTWRDFMPFFNDVAPEPANQHSLEHSRATHTRFNDEAFQLPLAAYTVEKFLCLDKLEAHNALLSRHWEMYCRLFQSNSYFHEIPISCSLAALAKVTAHTTNFADLRFNTTFVLESDFRLEANDLFQAIVFAPRMHFSDAIQNVDEDHLTADEDGPYWPTDPIYYQKTIAAPTSKFTSYVLSFFNDGGA
eukprot:Protomagalhaensia_sp_Gyna_25__1596@NODE_1822_length_1498_cov_21_358465_g1497_i0_p1_GENE_NODE_1822_length_1498_cov_21_358465_g1497_i0NODE_1822_length_1498_cov_21_358465_g1497_i0_p1_ORF_typecomplete_len412_score5_06_NODE_1822_length_1498_cov_21_358465_g1497_i01211356